MAVVYSIRQGRQNSSPSMHWSTVKGSKLADLLHDSGQINLGRQLSVTTTNKQKQEKNTWLNCSQFQSRGT